MSLADRGRTEGQIGLRSQNTQGPRVVGSIPAGFDAVPILLPIPQGGHTA